MTDLERLLWAVVRGEMPREVLADHMGDLGHPAEDELRKPLKPRLFIVIDVPGEVDSPARATITREDGNTLVAVALQPNPAGVAFQWQPGLNEVLAFGDLQLEDVTVNLLIFPR